MQGWRDLLGVASALTVFMPLAAAGETYDNPAMGDTPCIVLKSYQANANGIESYGADATVENVCGRSVEIAFCFPLVAPGEETEPHCTSSVIRPWATSNVSVSDLPARLAGPDYQWRWLNPTMN